VVAAALLDAAGRILIAQRPVGSHMAGGWEFPGGKLEAGELPLAGLARELHEELGIELGHGPHRPLRRVHHAYQDRAVLIQVWVVRDYLGVPQGLDRQALRWCTQSQLESSPLLPADIPIVRALRLPERLRLPSSLVFEVRGAPYLGATSDVLRGAACNDVGQARAAEAAGADFIVLSEPVPDAVLSQHCAGAFAPVYAKGIGLERAYELGATGINQIPSAE
jgi:mutator protein MutT